MISQQEKMETKKDKKIQKRKEIKDLEKNHPKDVGVQHWGPLLLDVHIILFLSSSSSPSTQSAPLVPYLLCNKWSFVGPAA